MPFHHFTGQDLYWCMEQQVESDRNDGNVWNYKSNPLGSLGLETFIGSQGESPDLGTPRLTEKRFEIATRHIDRTLPALDAPGLKVCSLGLRPEVLKLSLFEKEAVMKRGQVSPMQAGEKSWSGRGTPRSGRRGSLPER